MIKLKDILEGTRCWKGYTKKGTKTMFGKRVPNCVKNEDLVDQAFLDAKPVNEVNIRQQIYGLQIEVDSIELLLMERKGLEAGIVGEMLKSHYQNYQVGRYI